MQRTAIELTAVIVAVTDEVPRVLVVRRPALPLRLAPSEGGPDPLGGRSTPSVDADALPSGPFDPERHRTLDSGLRDWVEARTGLPLAYVEQLYTFADRYRDPEELAGGPRVVSVGYMALVRQAPLSGEAGVHWHDWYDYFPWEDWRAGRPAGVGRVIRPALDRWIERAPDAAERARRAGRVAIGFGLDDVAWDHDRPLDRYELLYEAGLLVEAHRDREAAAAAGLALSAAGSIETPRALGRPMALDHRRILAVALGRLRGKIKYRPLVFELLPPTFTLSSLQRVVEALSGVRLHKQNFRRLVIAGGLVEPTGQWTASTGGRPAELFRFRREAVHERPTLGLGLPVARTAD